MSFKKRREKVFSCIYFLCPVPLRLPLALVTGNQDDDDDENDGKLSCI